MILLHNFKYDIVFSVQCGGVKISDNNSALSSWTFIFQHCYAFFFTQILKRRNKNFGYAVRSRQSRKYC